MGVNELTHILQCTRTPYYPFSKSYVCHVDNNVFKKNKQTE